MKPHIKLKAAYVADSFQNFLTRTGIYTGNLSTGGFYGFNPVSRNHVQMEWVYRGSWIAGMAVDTVAHDMTREGVLIHTDDGPERKDALEKGAQALQIWKKLNETLKWSRLYGGALGFLMIDGQKPDTPLREDTVGQDRFKGILPLDRWIVQPSLQDLVEEYGPEFGLPRFYEVLPSTVGMPSMKIHYSRVIRLSGVELPYWQRIAENLWGQSVIERLWDRLVAFDSATQGAAQLVYKSHLRTLKIQGFRDLVAMGGEAVKGLVAQMDAIRQYQSNEGLTILDGTDEFQVDQYQFGGVETILLQLGMQISGALGVPLVRLFGQSPAGLNSTGESDLRTYYDNVKQQQESSLRPGVEKTYRVLYRSTFGASPPKSFKIEFAPLWQLDGVQRAQVANQLAAAILEAFEKQVIDRQTALKELRALALSTGVFSNITDEQINAAEDEPIPSPEQLAAAAGAENQPGGGGREPAEGTGPNANKSGRANLRAVA